MDKERTIEILTEIAEDMRKDAERFDGQPFTGKTVAEYFGCQGAAIAALTDTIKTLIQEEQKTDITASSLRQARELVGSKAFNAIIDPHYDERGRLDGGWVINDGILTGHINPKRDL